MTADTHQLRVLFVTWDGPQVAYLEALFLPIFGRLAKRGFCFRVIQFTWGDDEHVSRTKAICDKAEVPYEAVRVWRRPKGPGALASALRGGLIVRRTVLEHSIDVVMPRSIFPALSVLSALHLGSLQIVFDADGLAVDERVDFAGLSPKSAFYRAMRDVEAQIIRAAIVVVTRSEKASEILLHRAGAGTERSKFHVVRNGRDEDLFHPHDSSSRLRIRRHLGVAADAPLVAYVGSIGEQYCPNEMLRFFSFVLQRRPDARILVLSTSAPELRDRTSQFAIPADSMIGTSVEPHLVPEHLAAADVGLALRTPSFSMQGVSPIKLGEYLLCGVPLVATSRVGNTGVISPSEGYLVEHNDAGALTQAAHWFVDEVLSDREGFRKRCRDLGRRHFSLETTVEDYERALRQTTRRVPGAS